MNGWYAVSFFAGAVGHKVWRVLWRTHRHPVRLRRAVRDEFAPPASERTKPRRTPRITEVP
jgi:hypothetical protein